MAYNLGVARGIIELIYNSRGTDKAKDELDATLKKTQANKEALNNISRTAGIAGLAIAAGLGVAAKSAADFEKRMNAIEAVSGATQKEMEAVRKKALQLGADTAFSAGEAGLAIEELIKAGISVPDVLNGAADSVVALAAAGEVALPEAASIAAAAMNTFKISAKEMPGVADIIAGAANASAIDVNEFGLSLKQVGAVANLAGISFRDTAVAIALMGQAGIKGSDAGTSLKTMLMNLIPTTDKQKQAMRELGLLTKKGGNAFFDASGNVKSMSEIAGVLSKALKGMSKEQKLATLETLFGSDAIRAAAVLTDQGAKGFDKMAGAMGKVSAADVAKTKMKGLSGELEQLSGSLETLSISLGTILLPALTSITKKLTGFTNAIGELSPGMQKAIVFGAALTAGLLLMVAIAAKVASAYLTLSAALTAFKATALGAAIASKIAAVAKGIWAAATWILNAAIAVLTSPITLIIALIVLIVAAIILLWKKNETFRNIVMAVWKAILTAVKAVVNFFTGTVWPVLKKIFGFLISAVKLYVGVYIAAFKLIMTVIKVAVQFVMNVVRSFIATLSAIWNSFWGTFGGLIKAVWGLIVAIIRLAAAIVMFVIKSMLLGIKIIWNTIKNATLKIWNSISNVIRKAILGAKLIVSTTIKIIKKVVSTVWNAISKVTKKTWGIIKESVMRPIRAVASAISGPVNKVKSLVMAAWNVVSRATSRIWNGLRRTVGRAIGNVMDKVRNLKSRIVGFFSGAGRWLYNAGRRIIQGLINGITSLINRVTSKLNNLTAKIKAAKGPPEKDKVLLTDNGQLIMESLIKGLESQFPKVEDLLRNFTLTMPTALGASDVAALTLPSPAGRGGAAGSVVNNNYDIDVDAPQNMDPESVAEFTARRLSFAVSTGSGRRTA